jgi:hypothetical protein
MKKRVKDKADKKKIAPIAAAPVELVKKPK